MSWAAGVSPRECDDWTWGELLAAVRGWQERDRQQAQLRAVIARNQALMTAQAVARLFPGGKSLPDLPEVWEVFPGLWTEEETRAVAVEKYKNRMLRHAAAGKGGVGRGK